MIKERPIIFSGPMICAILDGRKSQTRRIVKPQPDAVIDGEPYWHIGGYRASRYRGVTDPLRLGTHNPLRCPYGVPGDRLWVRETIKASGDVMVYAADGQTVVQDGLCWPSCGERQTIPAIHMPRWASRITLEIVAVRVERVQKISEADAVAEGIEPDGPVNWDDLTSCWRNYDPHETAAYWNSPRDSFHSLWSAINGADSWNANPWVWVLDFKRSVAVVKYPKEVWVCDACLTACCWAGIFYCHEYKTAGIVKMPTEKLRRLNREHQSYWLRDEVQV